MSRQPLLRLRMVGRAAIGVLGVATALLLAPVAGAQPEVEANDAIAAAWQASGGDAGPLGPPTGDVYPAGEGFAQDFASGRMFFTPQTGAHYMQGAILDKYESLGGAADGDLGFPTIDEGPGLAPGSRNSTFSAPDNPVIFWTPEHGARVVRGPINAAWDALGGSTGALGVPVEDEAYDGSVTTQQFAAGQLSYDSQTDTFTTVPPELADQLVDLDVPNDPVSAINAARRAAGGPLGPLGAAEGEPYEIGDNGLGQDFVNGKIFYTPDTGANVVTGQVLAKYESVGGPQGDLGFPVTNETDGGLEPASRMSRFAAPDEPVIFWTPDHGAFIVRGPMNAAWQELGGATGELGAPVADQTQDGDVITQRFNGGSISWDTATQQFSTDPATLAGQLGGLEVPGEQGPAAEAPPTSNTGDGTGLQWNWWWLLAVVPIVLLVALVAFAVMRNRSRGEDPFAAPDDDELYAAAMAGDQHGADHGGEDALFGDRYAREGLGSLSGAPAPPTPSDDVSTPLSFWSTPVSDEDVDVEQEDPDAVDTAPTRIQSPAETELPVLDDYPDADYADEVAYDEIDYDDVDYDDDVLDEPVDEPAGELVDGPEMPEAGTDSEPPVEQAVASAALGEAAFDRDPLTDTGRHARIDVDEPTPGGTALHMPMGDPREVPGGYPVKADTQSGLYWAPDSPDYDDVPAEVYFASEEMAITMGFVRAY
ncbi:MAG: hypothetical protein SW019_08055 [Actinomycetota bacterium]|nr:hypothetical protein [Actinomycetota bacterium]